jgi:hypothetical protein
VPSRTTSRHRWYMVSELVSNPSIKRNVELKWNHIAKPDVIRRVNNAPVSGHGLGLTMW